MKANAPAVAIVVAAGVIPAVLFALVLRYAVDIPFWDEWGNASLVLAVHHGVILWAQAWAQHNEHRVIVPVLVFLALNRFGGWSELREILVMLGVATLTLAVVWRMAVETLPRAVVPYAFLAFSLLLFSLSQFECFFWAAAGFGWLLPNFLVVLGLWLVTRRRLTARATVAAFAACVLATFSEAPGMSSLFVGFIVVAIRPDAGWRRTASWLIGTVITVAVYTNGFNPNISGPGFVVSRGELLTDLPRFVLVYLGSPLAWWGGLWLAGGFGLAGIALVTGAAVAYARMRRAGESARQYLPWLALGAYASFNAVLTAYGRTGLGVGEALSSRYTVVSSDLWLGCIALALLVTLRYRRRAGARARVLTPVLAVVAAVVAFAYVRVQTDGYTGMRAFTARIALGSDAVHDFRHASDADLSLVYPDPRALRVMLGQLAAAGIATR